MTSEQSAAYITAMAACANAEIAAMQAENQACRDAGDRYLKHAPAAFLAVIEKYSIHHNAVLTVFAGAHS